MPLTPVLIKRLPARPEQEAKPFRLLLEPAPRRRLTGLGGSLVVHLMVILVGLGLLRHPTLQRVAEAPAEARPAPPEVQLIPLQPPAPQPEPQPQPPPEERPQLIRPPVVTPPTPPIDVEDFPDVVDELASRGEDGEQGQSESPDPADEPAPPATELASAPSMESEARRIFGRRGRRGAGEVEREEWTGPLPGSPNALRTCTMPPLPPARPGEPEPTSTASGRILAEDNRTPLSGAHLQVIGQPYSTFSGPGGQYRLTIPRKLVEDCRVQYVRVSATGYRSRLLPMSLGQAPVSDDVSLSRR